jgi:DNA-binding transcriptional MerR regulator
MTKIHRVETYLSPRNAERLTSLRRTTLARYVKRGLLTHYRTQGGHRRYALSELRALRDALRRRSATGGQAR